MIVLAHSVIQSTRAMMRLTALSSMPKMVESSYGKILEESKEN
jgi:hypothetical protein